MTDLTHLSLFSGIGGLDLAAEWAGFRTVGQCEFADYPTKVLEKHWPDVPRWRDIRTLTGDDFRERTGIDHPTVVSGGFPCQPHSLSGKRLASDDERDLWSELFRVFCETGGDGSWQRMYQGCSQVRMDGFSDEFSGTWPKVRALLNQYCGYHLAEDEIILLQINGRLWYIADITLRMLIPAELYRAMGFPADYIIDRDYTGKAYPKNQQVARCGNAVCPPMAAAAVRANLPEWAVEIETMAELERMVAV